MPDAFVAKVNATGTALLHSTYLGGSRDDVGQGIAVDAEGNSYITGTTRSLDFPGSAGSPIQSTKGGDSESFDAFVTKVNAAGTALVYATYLGGSSQDFGFGIAVDQAGNSYVTGWTDTPGSGFPGTASSSIQSTFGGGIRDAFVTKLNAAGTAIVFSTYLGGSGRDSGIGIAVDAAGNAYVTGDTLSSDFPGTARSSLQNLLRGARDAFVAKISSGIPFAAFDARAKIDVDDRRNYGGGSHRRPHDEDAEMSHHPRQDDEFELVATFTLGPGSNGIDPFKEAVIVQVGTFSTSIPAGLVQRAQRAIRIRGND